MENPPNATSLPKRILQSFDKCFRCFTKKPSEPAQTVLDDDTYRHFELTAQQRSSPYLTLKKHCKDLESNVQELKTNIIKKNKEIKQLEIKLKSFNILSEENYRLDAELDKITRSLQEKNLLIISLTSENAKLKEKSDSRRRLSTQIDISYSEFNIFEDLEQFDDSLKNPREELNDIYSNNRESSNIITEVNFM